MKNLIFNSGKIIFLLIILLLSFPSQAQSQKYTISGYVKDEESGEVLLGISLSVKEMPEVGRMTNDYGFYSITLPEGTYTLVLSGMGYQTKAVPVELHENRKLDLTLASESIQTEEVVITVEKKNENIVQTQMGVDKLDVKEANKLPVLLGERDIIKTLQMTPGIKAGGEGNAGFYVRGGSADQNLILLDDAPVYNASHMLGFFSVFNSDAIKDVTVYKGTMPAQYGGRIASVLDIKMNDGNNQRFNASGGIGLISSRLTVEGPLVKNKGSFIVSARRSYADLFLKLSSKEAIRKTMLYFYDLNLKANYTINDNNKVFLSGYFGKDVLGYKGLFGFDWGNATGTFRWNHIFSSKLFSNTSLIFSNFNYRIKIGLQDNQFEVTSTITDYNVKQDFQYYASPRSTLRFGVNSIYHKISPGKLSSSSDSYENTTIEKRYGWENAAYIAHEFKLTEKINFNYGIRLSAFSVLGPGTFYSISNGKLTDSIHYQSGDFIKTYVNPEPRFAANYILNERTSFKASYTRNVQNIHQLSNSTAGSPTDLWILSSNYIKPEIADLVSLGYYKNFNDNKYQFSAEVYYKDMQNQIDYKDNANLIFNEKVEAELLIGKGRAYGVELFLKKKFGRFNGWIGYTLSRTEKKIDGINNGRYYAAKQDRTHDISIVGIYELNKKWTLSGAWIYYTGNAVTFPNGKYEVLGKVLNQYSERNNHRMPAYHRFDIAATLQRKKTEKFESSWTFSIYNIYARGNAYSIIFREDPKDATKTQAVKVSLFQFVPSVTYNFKFL